MTTARTFRAEGKTFNTASKRRYAVVVTARCHSGYDENRQPIFEGSALAGIVHRTDDVVAAQQDLAKWSTVGYFVSGTVVDTYTGQAIR